MTGVTFKQVCFKRMFGAVFCNIFIQIVFLSGFILVIDIDPFHPVSWIKTWGKNFITLSTWLYFFPVCIVMCAQGIVSSKEYIRVPKLQPTRFAIIKSVFSVHNAIVAVLHVFIGYNVPWIYTSFAGEDYNSYTTPCIISEVTKSCLIEERLFLVFAGVWMGFYYFIHSHILNDRFVTFPIIQQHKLVQVKARFFSTVRESMRYIMLPTSLYVIFYYFKGGSLRNFVCDSFSLSMKNKPMDSIFDFFNVKALIFLWTFSLLIVVSMKLMELLFKIFLTQRHTFPIFYSGDSKDIVLEEGLQNGNVPIIQHLAFLDLYLLSDKCQNRRKEVFTVSQPGGHPHTWNAIRRACFSVIENFTVDFKDALKAPFKDLHLSETVQTPFILCPNEQEKKRVVKSALAGSPLKIRPLLMDSSSFQEYASRNKQPSSSHDNYQDMDYTPEALVPLIYECINTKINAVKNLAVVNYFFGDIQETRVENLILNCLPVMWASQSLSLLACSSLVEDNYGVMQNDLSKIIIHLLQLKQVLDSHSKKVGTSKKSPKQNEFVVRMRNSLRASVKRSLYRIAITFKLFLSDLQLPLDTERQMLSFIGFKES